MPADATVAGAQADAHERGAREDRLAVRPDALSHAGRAWRLLGAARVPGAGRRPSKKRCAAFRTRVCASARAPRRCSGTGRGICTRPASCTRAAPNNGVFVLVTASAARGRADSGRTVFVRHARARAGDRRLPVARRDGPARPARAPARGPDAATLKARARRPAGGTPMRYLVTARLKPGQESPLREAMADGTLGQGSVAGDEYIRNMCAARRARRRPRAVGRGLLLSDAAPGGAGVLGGVLHARESAGRSRAQPVPRPDRRGAVGVLRLRLLEQARSEAGGERASVSPAGVP